MKPIVASVLIYILLIVVVVALCIAKATGVDVPSNVAFGLFTVMLVFGLGLLVVGIKHAESV